MNRLFTSSDCCKLCDDIEDFYKNLKRGVPTREDITRNIAERIQTMQKEENRINRESNLKEVGMDSIEDLIKYLKEEAPHVCVYVENIGRDFFDYERGFRKVN